MAHRSRLSQAIARDEVCCIICGCGENNPCTVLDEEGNRRACSWLSPGLCDNPECVQEFEAEFGEGVLPEPADQDEYEFQR